MVHKKNFVVAVKVDGKVLRESNDRVELPFGSEYSLLLKNLDSVWTQAKISIDGEDATGWLVLQPNSSIDVERFVKDLDRGNRFKFIERTDRVEQHRGIKAEDGLIRVEFKREKVYDPPKLVEHHTYHHHYNDWYYRYPYYPNYPYYPSITCGTLTSSGSQNFQCFNNSLSGASGNIGSTNLMRSAEVPVNDAGITVPGSLSNQKFISVSNFETEQSEVIVLHLIGRKGGVSVQVTKTVQIKLQCETCGKKNKSSSKFCAECGTSLEKV